MGVAGRLRAAAAAEIDVLSYGLIGWSRRVDEGEVGTAFSGHRRNGYPAVLGAFLMAIAVETLVVHLLLSLWRPPVAWVLTTLGIYSMIWLMGDFNAARLKPTLVTEVGIHIRTGLRWRADVAWSEILGIRDQAPSGEGIALTLWGDPDFWIECREAVTVAGPFGIEKRARYLGVGADDDKGLLKATRRQLGPPIDSHAEPIG